MIAFQGRLYVVKFGSGCLDDLSLIQRKAQEIEQLEATKGYRFILVVSGAIALGKRLVGEARQNQELSNRELQMYAALGQPKLIQAYSEAFGNKHVAQLLLHKYEISSRKGLVANLVTGINSLARRSELPFRTYGH